MMSFLEIPGWALLTVVLGALAVATWEHMRREADAARRRSSAEPLPARPADGVAQAAATERAQDSPARPEAGAPRKDAAWLETRPMINPGSVTTTQPLPAAEVAQARSRPAKFEVDLLLG